MLQLVVLVLVTVYVTVARTLGCPLTTGKLICCETMFPVTAATAGARICGAAEEADKGQWADEIFHGWNMSMVMPPSLESDSPALMPMEIFSGLEVSTSIGEFEVR